MIREMEVFGEGGDAPRFCGRGDEGALSEVKSETVET
jgi:hypothetical protein